MTDPAHPHRSAEDTPPDERPSIAELQRKEQAMLETPWLCSEFEAEDGEVWSSAPHKLLARTSRHPVAANASGIAALRDAAPVLLEIAAAALAALPELQEEFEPGLTCMHGGVGERLAAALAKVRP